MSLELAPATPRSPDSGPRKRDQRHLLDLDIKALHSEFAALEAEQSRKRRDADWGHVGGDLQAQREGGEAAAWLRDEYPRRQVEFIHRFGKHGFLPWADDAGHLHFYAAPPAVSFEEMTPGEFTATVQSWIALKAFVQMRITMLVHRQEALRDKKIRIPHLSAYEKRDDHFHDQQFEEIRLMEDQTAASLSQLEKQEEKMDIFLATALPFAAGHGLSVQFRENGDLPMLVPAATARASRGAA